MSGRGRALIRHMDGNLIDMINCMAALPGAAAPLGWFLSFDPIRLILQIRRLIYLFKSWKEIKENQIELLYFLISSFPDRYAVKHGFETPNSIRLDGRKCGRETDNLRIYVTIKVKVCPFSTSSSFILWNIRFS